MEALSKKDMDKQDVASKEAHGPLEPELQASHKELNQVTDKDSQKSSQKDSQKGSQNNFQSEYAIDSQKESEIENHLVSIIRSFISEFKAERVLSAVSLHASLDRDLGIDSLGRVELFLRIEKGFNIILPESLMAEVDTVKDILKAIQTAKPDTTKIEREFVTKLEAARFDPSSVSSLVEVLIKHAASDPKRPHIYLANERGEETVIRYGELLEGARKVAAGLLELGLKREETVALMLPTSESFFHAFFGILLAGGIPVPIYPPVRPDKIEEYALREAGILNNAEVRILITFSQVETLGRLLRVFIKSLKAVTTVEMLMRSNHKVPNLTFEPEDSAMIQYTSGSTSAPKGVLLSHANLLANIRSVGQAIQVSPNDVGISWLPLYHDMGLIGAWFCSLYQGFPLTLMSPLTFLTRPERWLWAIHYHRGTLSAGPNFAYELCIRRIKDEDIVGLDLSSWRLAFNGAEAINPKTLERFTKKFEPYGFKAESFFPVYGLAECAVALSFPPMKRKPRIDVVKRDPFEKNQVALPAEKGDSNILEFVCCGSPIPEHEFRVVDSENNELEERKVGSLQFCGPSAMRGYYRNPVATQAVYHDGWWDTGDFAYIAEGELYITGRKKDMIIKAGRNLYPQEIEEAAAQITGVRKGCVVAIGVDDPSVGTEKLVVIAETSESKTKIRDTIISEIVDKVSTLVGVPPDEVCLVPPRTIPKTSSGKLQRSACKNLYLEGKLGKSGTPVWLQVSKLILMGTGIKLWGTLNKIGKILYTSYVGLLLLVFLPCLWLTVSILPRKASMQTFRTLVRTLIFFAGIRIEINGLENLKSLKKGVYIANHASYADSVFLLAFLPSDVLFIGKKELMSWPLVNTVIKKFGYLTIDRMDFSKNISDTKVIEEQLASGHSILIFPEGTFTYATGLRPFKMGAFKLAVDTETPIVPIALQGTRKLLRGGSILLSPHKIKMTISEPIQPSGKDWGAVTKLHAQARAEISKNCGELSLDMVAAGVDPARSQ